MELNEDNRKKIIEELKKIMHAIDISYNDKSEGSDYQQLERCVRILGDKNLLEDKENAEFIKEFLSRDCFFNMRWAFDNLEYINSYGYENLSNLANLCENEFMEI